MYMKKPWLPKEMDLRQETFEDPLKVSWGYVGSQKDPWYTLQESVLQTFSLYQKIPTEGTIILLPFSKISIAFS